MVEEAHAEVTKLLSSHRGQLDGLAHALLVAETLDAAAAYAAAGVKMPGRAGARARAGDRGPTPAPAEPRGPRGQGLGVRGNPASGHQRPRCSCGKDFPRNLRGQLHSRPS